MTFCFSALMNLFVASIQISSYLFEGRLYLIFPGVK